MPRRKKRSSRKSTKKKHKRHISSARKAAFMRGRKAALAAGWTPFTKMSAKEKSAFRAAYNRS